MRAATARPTPAGHSRRGVTLVEMLVVVALVVLMMTILVQIFSAATGAISISRTNQELDANLRLLDATIRRDLGGITARMTPPNDPKNGTGYFEYIENSAADAQLEDTDDSMAFTTKAPEGVPFTGRFYVPLEVAGGGAIQPVTITSDYAEVIYFLRNGNLYRRVLLIVPERQGSVSNGAQATGGYTPPLFNNLPVSWQGMHDVSARPGLGAETVPQLNTLGTLTNRENRFPRPRFSNDYYHAIANSATPDGIPDDRNNDGIPDYYPTLNARQANSGNADRIVNEANPPTRVAPFRSNGEPNYDSFAFPFIFPGAYAKPDPNTSLYGWINGQVVPTAGIVLDPTNHAPLDLGEDPLIGQPMANTNWGFPTWRETMAATWTDPVRRVNRNTPYTQSRGLRPFSPNASGGGEPDSANPTDPNWLPPIDRNRYAALGAPVPAIVNAPPVASDGYGSSNMIPVTNAQVTANPSLNANMIWEDDLIMVGVRSFDIKAYDNSYGKTSVALPGTGGYVDLGYGSDPDVNIRNLLVPGVVNYSFNFLTLFNPAPSTAAEVQAIGRTTQFSYAHEGRMPPLANDYRFDAQAPAFRLADAFNRSSGSFSDDPSVIRLRRVFDTWSTDYTTAPALDVNLYGYHPTLAPRTRPVYPSYPPPYPLPLRGLQITIRVVDPQNQRIRTLTIRQDFTNKL